MFSGFWLCFSSAELIEEVNWLLECCGLLCCRMHHCLSVSFLLQIAANTASFRREHQKLAPAGETDLPWETVPVCCTQGQFVPRSVEALCSLFYGVSFFLSYNINYAFGSSCCVRKCLTCFWILIPDVGYIFEWLLNLSYWLLHPWLIKLKHPKYPADTCCKTNFSLLAKRSGQFLLVQIVPDQVAVMFPQSHACGW